MTRPRTPLPPALRLAVGLVALGAWTAGCGRAPGDAERTAPILLIGLDGLEWDVALPLVASGRMPNLEALMARGSYGYFATMRPTMSPVIWTTMATGKPPEEHGILGFARPAEIPGGERELYTSRDLSAKPFWVVAGELGKRVAVVGWWMTSPVYEVNGVLVAQTNTSEQVELAMAQNIWKGRLLPGAEGQVYPPERTDEMMAVLGEVEDELPDLRRRIFGSFQHPLSELDGRLWENCSWAFRADATYARIAEKLLAEPEPYDVLAVYLGGPDVVGHRFMRYRLPDLFAHRPTAAQVADLGHVVDDYYVWVDDLVGRLVRLAGPEYRVLVVSDHGMKPFNLPARFDPDDPPIDTNSGHHLDAPPGVIVAAGPDLRRRASAPAPRGARPSELETLASVRDLAKTVLVLLGLPTARDMQGEVAADLIEPGFLQRHPVREVPTYDDPEWVRARAAHRSVDLGASERLEQLRDLGYLGEGVDEPTDGSR